MDRNLLLAFVLSTLIFVGWMTYQQQVVLPERRAEAERVAAEAKPGGDSAPSPAEAAPARRAEPLPPVAKVPAVTPPSPVGAADDTPALPAWSGVLENDAVRARYSNRGGVVTGWQLKSWFETPRDEVQVELLELPSDVPAAFTTPLAELGLGDLSTAQYAVEESTNERIVFALRRSGVVIRKSYQLVENGYMSEIEIVIENNSDRVLAPRFDLVIPAVQSKRPDWKELSLVARHDGKVTRELVRSLGTAGFMGGIFGGYEGPIVFPSGVQWGGVDLRYFAGLVVSDDPESTGVTIEPLEVSKIGIATLNRSPVEIAPGSSVTHTYRAFMGPKQPALLASVGYDLDQTISRGYSWVAPLTSFFGWALHLVHDVIPNYGLAIILLTVMVRLATWPIMARQMKSAERMRELMPRIKELQEKFKDDRQKQSEETFKLYRETGVNPLGGCLPMVLQLPVFIGLFYALQSSIDLRHAPFFLWINDLSAPATLFTIPGTDFPVRLLPLLMGASMYGQQKMMPQTGMDPTQARMMLVMMPGMMLVISYTFPSGLVLYWMVSNLLGIAHQLFVRSRMHAESS